jgi:prevent-host-death family protein
MASSNEIPRFRRLETDLLVSRSNTIQYIQNDLLTPLGQVLHFNISPTWHSGGTHGLLARKATRRLSADTELARRLALTAEHGYHSHIHVMRSTNIADLRNRLTQYLQEVRAGEEIVVRDRQRPIAKIVPFSVDDDDADDAALVASGLMRKGSGTLPASFWQARRPRVPLSTAVAALGADRDEG